MLNSLDPVIHAPVRLAIMSLLVGVKSAEFSFLLENIGTSKGNLSFQLTKLKEAGYIQITKSFRGSYPLTTCEITPQGAHALEQYVSVLSAYLQEIPKRESTNF